MSDVVVIGGGQAGLAAGYYLRRTGADFIILDAQPHPGGAWRHVWPSLSLFSPAQYSSLPGRRMPIPPDGGYPSAADTVSYLTDYEHRYDLPVHRPVTAHAVRPAGERLLAETDRGTWRARVVISATGTWWRPFVPHYPGMRDFHGQQLHTAAYRGPEPFAGRRVVIVGGANSGANLGDIVAVPSVRKARDRGVLKAEPMFTHLTRTGIAWADGTTLDCDAIIWCTGFRPVLSHLAPLKLRGPDGVIPVRGTQAIGEPRLHLLGYGDWTGHASATLIGASRTARDMVAAIAS
ncbi:FAD-dependent oxidoreductase [Nonomuraea typhae]|uniref:FAD-dependent oxidoreductase n=1 Tax=Nonomuraea typhae TaxID=2603600 RepID=UPI0012F7C074|nr:FAD-dependent oxidoreductase [Nonomuraea typhae]